MRAVILQNKRILIIRKNLVMFLQTFLSPHQDTFGACLNNSKIIKSLPASPPPPWPLYTRIIALFIRHAQTFRSYLRKKEGKRIH